jgi:hypothetical protein
VVIPRPRSKDEEKAKRDAIEGSSDGTDEGPQTGEGVGRIFVHFADIVGSIAAQKALHGRKYNNMNVEAIYYSEELFENRYFCDT